MAFGRSTGHGLPGPNPKRRRTGLAGILGNMSLNPGGVTLSGIMPASARSRPAVSVDVSAIDCPEGCTIEPDGPACVELSAQQTRAEDRATTNRSPKSVGFGARLILGARSARLDRDAPLNYPQWSWMALS